MPIRVKCSANIWRFLNSNDWECVTSDYYDCVSKIFKYNFQYLGATFKFLEGNANFHCNTIFAAGIPKFGSFYQVE